jgi:hypothetical protein
VPNNKGAMTTIIIYQSTTGLSAKGCLLLKPNKTLIVYPKKTNTLLVATESILAISRTNKHTGTNKTPPPIPLTAARQLIKKTRMRKVASAPLKS